MKTARCSYLCNDVSIGVFNRLYLIVSTQLLNGQFEQKTTKRNVDNWRHYVLTYFFDPKPWFWRSLNHFKEKFFGKSSKKMPDIFVQWWMKQRRKGRNLARKWKDVLCSKERSSTYWKKWLNQEHARERLWPEYWSPKAFPKYKYLFFEKRVRDIAIKSRFPQCSNLQIVLNKIFIIVFNVFYT